MATSENDKGKTGTFVALAFGTTVVGLLLNKFTGKKIDTPVIQQSQEDEGDLLVINQPDTANTVQKKWGYTTESSDLFKHTEKGFFGDNGVHLLTNIPKDTYVGVFTGNLTDDFAEFETTTTEGGVFRFWIERSNVRLELRFITGKNKSNLKMTEIRNNYIQLG